MNEGHSTNIFNVKGRWGTSTFMLIGGKWDISLSRGVWIKGVISQCTWKKIKLSGLQMVVKSSAGNLFRKLIWFGTINWNGRWSGEEGMVEAAEKILESDISKRTPVICWLRSAPGWSWRPLNIKFLHPGVIKGTLRWGFRWLNRWREGMNQLGHYY